MRVALRHRNELLAVDVKAERGGYRVAVDGQQYLVEVKQLDNATLVLSVDGCAYRVEIARNGHQRFVAVGGEVYAFVPERPTSTHTVATMAAAEVTAPMPGKVLQVLVQPGDRVEVGDGLLVVEAMKMETRLVAEAAATVAEVRAAAGDMVQGGQVLVVLKYD